MKIKQSILNNLAIMVFSCPLAYAVQPLSVNDFSTEAVGAEPTSFTPAVGNWSIGMDEGKKVLIVDGSKWEEGKASGNLAEKAKAIYGDRYAQFLDNVKAYALVP